MTVRRRGFTLIEVMVALVVTGLVVSLAYATLRGGLDIQQRLTVKAADDEALISVRSMLRDALRHALPGVPGGSETFSLLDRVTPAGEPADSMAFLTRGVVPPFGTSGTWRVSVSVGAGGLQMTAAPVSAGTGLRQHATVPSVTSLDIRALGRGVIASWTSGWPDAGVAPQAVTLALGGVDGSVSPLVSRLGLERVQ